MHNEWAELASAVSQDTGFPATQIVLLRHASSVVLDLLRHGGSVEEYTSLQPTGSKYDFAASDRAVARIAVVIVHDRVYDVYEVAGIEAEGTTYGLADPVHRDWDIERGRPDRPARRFDLRPVPSRVVGQPVRGWERRTRTTVQRADGGFFHEIRVELAGGGAPGSVEQVREDFQTIVGSGAPETSRTALMQARLGQGRFRRDLMALWGSACAVTGCDVDAVLRASHCKPWRDSTDAERLNPANGLLLTATLDALFDAGLITFSDEGQMLMDPSLSEERQVTLGLESRPLRESPSAAQRAFLRYHREHVFRSAVEPA